MYYYMLSSTKLFRDNQVAHQVILVFEVVRLIVGLNFSFWMTSGGVNRCLTLFITVKVAAMIRQTLNG
jgi:hypothetical protein